MSLSLTFLLILWSYCGFEIGAFVSFPLLSLWTWRLLFVVSVPLVLIPVTVSNQRRSKIKRLLAIDQHSVSTWIVTGECQYTHCITLAWVLVVEPEVRFLVFTIGPLPPQRRPPWAKRRLRCWRWRQFVSVFIRFWKAEQMNGVAKLSRYSMSRLRRVLTHLSNCFLWNFAFPSSNVNALVTHAIFPSWMEQHTAWLSRQDYLFFAQVILQLQDNFACFRVQ